MNPINNIICSLLETPFSRWTDDNKRDVLLNGRPTKPLLMSATKELRKSGKSYNVRFKSVWFSNYNWLCTSDRLQKMFCWSCLLFSKKQLTWNKEGFSDLLNSTKAFRQHEDSREHIKCDLMLRNFKKNPNTIAGVLKENSRLYKIQFNENVRLNRLFLQTVIDAVLFLSKQELAFRGHDESTESMNRANFKELMKLLISRGSLEIQNHYEKIKNLFTEDSKTIQNELKECISDYINIHLVNEIKNAQFFSIQVDDTTDITQTSQCSLLIRYVNSDGILVERFLGFHDVSGDRTSENLYNMLDNILNKFDYKNKLIGQCYDGASVMTSHLNELQMKFKSQSPQAVLVHCLAHRLNLVLQQSFKKMSKCRIFFAIIAGIPSFVHHSVKRAYALNSASAGIAITDTRWSNSKLLEVIIQYWDKLKGVFHFIINSEESDQKSVQLAKGFLNEMEDFEFTFLAIVFKDIFSTTEILFNILQKKSLDINFCISYIIKTRELLQNKRNEDFFKEMFGKALLISQLDINNLQNAGLSQEAVCVNYRLLFYEILDHILAELNMRFQDYEKLKFVSLADTSKFEEYHSNFPSSALDEIQQIYGNMFSKITRFRNELSHIYANENYRNIPLRDLVKKLNENKDLFTEAYKLFSLVLTIPSTNASADKSFPCLKRTNSVLKNSMIQERSSSLENISIHKELLSDLMLKQPFYDDIIDNFAALKDRRMDLIYVHEFGMPRDSYEGVLSLSITSSVTIYL